MRASKDLLQAADKQSKDDMARFASLYLPASSASAAAIAPIDGVDDSMVSVGSSIESPEDVYDDGEFEAIVEHHLVMSGALSFEPSEPPGVAAMTAAAAKAEPLVPSSQWAKPKKKTEAVKNDKGDHTAGKAGKRLCEWAVGAVRKRPAAAQPQPAALEQPAASEQAAEAVDGKTACEIAHPVQFAGLPVDARPAVGAKTGDHSYSLHLDGMTIITIRVRDPSAIKLCLCCFCCWCCCCCCCCCCCYCCCCCCCCCSCCC
jgi:hypothetical protein